MSYPHPNSIGESLGQRIARAWQKPFVGTTHESMGNATHIVIAGGRSLGIWMAQPRPQARS